MIPPDHGLAQLRVAKPPAMLKKRSPALLESPLQALSFRANAVPTERANEMDSAGLIVSGHSQESDKPNLLHKSNKKEHLIMLYPHWKA
jgi:hypothetical protein